MEIIRLDDENFAKTLKRATDILKRGGIVLYPTDTLYGLAVDALNRPALEKLRLLKGREKKKPISIVVPDVTDIETHAQLHQAARPLVERHLPGALTLVLPGRKHIPDELMLNGQIGIRIPDEAFARELARSLKRPVTATSANLAGLPTPSSVHAIIAQLGMGAHHVDLVIDAGERGGGTPSTVITFVNETPYILREGAISREELGF